MEEVTAQEFFANKPPGVICKLSDISVSEYNMYRNRDIYFPEISLVCSSKECNGERFFSSQGRTICTENRFVIFKCNNCTKYIRTYALQILMPEEDIFSFEKIGELPSFGEKIPNQLLDEFDRSNQILMLKGKKSENQNLGIGAFSYYRRVVENERDKLIDLLVKTIKNTSGNEHEIKKLEAIKNNHQFLNSIETVAEILPKSFFIKNENPFRILHSWLSFDIHAGTDEGALENAHHIRLLLTELVKKMAELNKNDQGLHGAIKAWSEKMKQKNESKTAKKE